MDPVSGKCIWTGEQIEIPVKRLKHYIEAVKQGTFVPDRENDELTMALGNPEHPGRTRGTPGSIPWKIGFSDAGGYKCQERRKKVQQTQMQALQARVQAIEEQEANRSKRTAEASPEATPPSQRRSSVASTELLQPEHALDGSCQLSRGCYHGVSKLPPYDAMDEFEGQGGCWLCLSY